MTIITTAKAKSKNNVTQLNKKKLKQYFRTLYPEPFVRSLTAKNK